MVSVFYHCKLMNYLQICHFLKERDHKLLIFVFSVKCTYLAHSRCTGNSCSMRRPWYWIFLLAPRSEYVMHFLLTNCWKLSMGFVRGINRTSVPTATEVLLLARQLVLHISFAPTFLCCFVYLSAFPTWSQTPLHPEKKLIHPA